jgi:adenylyltransferase/sulfurtransferase
MLSPEELHRYSRQVLLPSFGREGQEKLKASSVLVIGAGGLGAPVLQYLAAAGVGKIGIVDFDSVDVSNLQRQVLFATADVGKSKASIAAERLKGLNPLIQIESYLTQISSANAKDIISSYDVVVDGSDNLPTRYLVNDACVFLNKPLVYGAIFQFEGQVSVFNQLLNDGTRGPNYRDLFPEPPPPEMVTSCSEGGVLGVLPGIIGSMQANEALKIIANMGTTLSGRLLLFNSLDFTTRMINIRRSPSNPLNGNNPTIFDLIDYEQFCNPAKKESTISEIEPETLKQWMDSGKEIQVIDVRESQEVSIVSLDSKHIPLKDVEQKFETIRKDIPVVIYCKSGGRSSTAIRTLESKYGFKNLVNLKGGIIGWINNVDPTLPKY